jgi:hypothetical protein
MSEFRALVLRETDEGNIDSGIESPSEETLKSALVRGSIQKRAVELSLPDALRSRDALVSREGPLRRGHSLVVR